MIDPKNPLTTPSKFQITNSLLPVLLLQETDGNNAGFWLIPIRARTSLATWCSSEVASAWFPILRVQRAAK